MATNVSDHKNVYGTFENAAEWVQATYNFAVESGATGDYDLFTAKEDLVILDFYADVQTAVTSGGSLTMDLGTTSPSAATAIWSNKAVANLTLDSVHAMDTANKLRVASAGIVRLTLEAAAATAGKIVFNFLVKKQ